MLARMADSSVAGLGWVRMALAPPWTDGNDEEGVIAEHSGHRGKPVRETGDPRQRCPRHSCRWYRVLRGKYLQPGANLAEESHDRPEVGEGPLKALSVADSRLMALHLTLS